MQACHTAAAPRDENPISVAAGANYNFQVQFTPSTAGQVSGTGAIDDEIIDGHLQSDLIAGRLSGDGKHYYVKIGTASRCMPPWMFARLRLNGIVSDWPVASKFTASKKSDRIIMEIDGSTRETCVPNNGMFEPSFEWANR